MNHISDRIKELTAPTGEEPILDVAYPTPRVKIAPWQAVLAAIGVVIAVLLWLALSNRESEALPPLEPVAEIEETTSEAELPSEVVVSVVGAVHNPGIITLPQGSRVADALEMSGLADDADIISINHAQLLADGEQIYVSRIGEEARPEHNTEPSSESGTGKVNLNSATAADLMALPGVGQVTADAIIAYRDTIGSFNSVDQLMDVSGIGPAKFEKLQDHVSV